MTQHTRLTTQTLHRESAAHPSEQKTTLPERKLLLTPQEAAHALGINRSTLYQLIMRQEIRSLKIGRRRYVPYAVLQTFIESRLSA